MSYKTDRLTALLPDILNTDTESLFYHLLDAVAAELMQADEAVKGLLHSHWVDYAQGDALDGLGSIFNVSRRQLRGKDQSGTVQMETDDAFRLRLKSVVALYTGGGTVNAIKGAVRSALGLPFNLDQLKLTDDKLKQAIDNLVTVREFKANFNTLQVDNVQQIDNMSILTVGVDSTSTEAQPPEIEWRFTSGSGRHLSVTMSGSTDGLQSKPGFIVPQDAVLYLSSNNDGLHAVLNGQDVSSYFVGSGGKPARLPSIPQGHSEWTFRAGSGFWDESHFDTDLFGACDSFDTPAFQIKLQQAQKIPLEIEVVVPYHLESAVGHLAEQYKYNGPLLVFAGLPPESIQEVVDDTRAAGVRATVQFTLNLYEDHPMAESMRLSGVQSLHDDMKLREGMFAIGTLNRTTESNDTRERLLVGNVFDRTNFDGVFGFVA